MRRLLIPLLLTACHPLSLWSPPPLPKSAQGGVSAKVEILVDDRGIPHIYGSTLPDVSYGLGYMHGRDRLFQIILLQHASQGRLTELFGEKLLQTDKMLRLVAYRLDDHVAALGEDDRRILDAYAAGLTAGAKNAGKSAEMAVLGLAVPTFTARDALGIMRLQAWQLGVDHFDEIVRMRVLELLPEGDPRRRFIDAPVTTGGVSVTGLGDAPEPLWGSLSIGDGPAASNSWAVDAAHTASGHAVLSNDPHLDHMAPGVFYLAHLETPDFTAAGATLPGGPVVVIGTGRHLAWGMTSSFADAQDLLRIKTPKGRDDVYELDGQLVPFGKLEQTFVVGKKTITETWRTTRFGPVLPDDYPAMKHEEPYAMAWGGFDPELNANVVTGFIGLAAAKDVTEAGRAVEKVRGSGQNVVFAFTDGSIAYRLAAFSPVRPKGELGRLPRDGSKSANGFSGYLSVDERPKVDAPASGVLVTANQRVIGDADPRIGSVGTVGVSPSRAVRIHQRLDALLSRGPEHKATADEILAIQRDTVSPEAKLAVPRLAALCPFDAEPELCGAVQKFDGNFSKDSWGALPYVMLVKHIGLEVVRTFSSTLTPEQTTGLASTLAAHNAIGRALFSPEPQTLIDKPLVARAARQAHDELVERAGNSPSQWRYGKLHRLTLAGPLAVAPLVGGYFDGEPHEEGGHGSVPYAEDGLPVKHGPCLRMLAELSDPPVARFTIDTGQSGNPSDPHWMDQYPDWAKGAPRVVSTVRSEVEASAQGRVELLP
jgi:penicillin G amidase